MFQAAVKEKVAWTRMDYSWDLDSVELNFTSGNYFVNYWDSVKRFVSPIMFC